MRLGWLTDIHLDFADLAKREQFYGGLRAERLDGILLGGDIGEAESVGQFLHEMANFLEIPIYFVLGDHDFYGGSFERVRQAIRSAAAASPWLSWLTDCGVVPLSASTALIGHDSWADGRLGDFFGSGVMMNDYFLIEDLVGASKQELFGKLNRLGDEAAEFLEVRVQEALGSFERVIAIVHPPPFREACVYQGRICADDYLPHFACKAAGDRLAALMRLHPKNTLEIFCGHTHSPAFVQVLDNLTVRAGSAIYGEPALQLNLEI